MEDSNIGVINLSISNKNKEADIINDNINKENISRFNSTINSLFIEGNMKKLIPITNRKIYLYFMRKYKYSRNISYILKQKNKSFTIKNSEKLKNYLNSFILFYMFIELGDIKQKLTELKLLSLNDFFKLIIFLYKNNILSLQNVINIFKYNFILLEKNNNLTIPQKAKIISSYIKYLWKLSKETKINNNEKEIDKLIQKEILPIFFEIINDAHAKYDYLFLLNNLKKEENIFLFIKMIIKNEFLSEETKSIIESNIVTFLKNNFKKEHLNYFYKICSNILLKFNNLNPKTYLKTDNKKDYISLNKDFNYLIKIIEILIKVINEEKKEITDNTCYYCDKGFVFNIEGENKIGLSVKDVVYNPSKKDSIFCILFTFLLRKNKNINDKKIIFSINNLNNKECLCLFEKCQKIYFRYTSNKLNEIEIVKNIKYNNYYSFFLFYDKNKIRICINNEEFTPKGQDFQIPNKFHIFVGAPDSNEILKKHDFSFNGIICPILLFEINYNVNIYYDIKKNLLKVKNNYYLIAESFFESIQNDNKENIVDNYEKYYCLYDELESKEYAKSIINNINNIILYINPSIVLSSFNKKARIYKYYNYYEIHEEKKNKISQYNSYSYEFNVIPSSENGIIFPFKNNSIVSFFKNNNGINFIILEIELIYNYILLINDNNNFIALLNENKNEILTLM